MKIKNTKVISIQDWNKCVQKTYGRPYNFQQQSGCQDRHTFHLTVPDQADDFKNDSVPEVVNGPQMGVSFKAWLKRNPRQPIKNQKDDWELSLWWERNFYPDIQTVANDLYKRGILKAGKYSVEIDW